MAQGHLPTNSLQRQAVETVHQAGPWIERLARAGYVAKGAIYFVIGILALEAAFTSGGKTTNSQGALAAIVREPFGHFLLVLLGIGLAAYALWRFVQAGIDTENRGTDMKGAATRLGYVLSGAGYAALAYTAYQILTGSARNTSGNQNTEDWTARVLAAPFGPWLVGLVGLIIIGIGVAQIVKGYKADFGEKLERRDLNASQWKWVMWSGQWGYIARGIVFAIIGGFVMEAAINSNPKQAKGIGSALDLLAGQPYGPWLLGLVAAGLMAYGVFMFVEARYRRIDL